VPPYDAAVDSSAYQALTGPLLLSAGVHSIVLRDVAGGQTQAQAITVPPPIVIGAPTYTCADNKYTATASINGGTPPYEVNGKQAQGIITDATASGTAVRVTVKDSKGCVATAEFNHVCCTLPCAGIALNRGFRFFIPDADPNDAYQLLELSVTTFTVDSATGKPPVDLSAQVRGILHATPAQLSPGQFSDTVNGWIKAINSLVASHADLSQTGKAQWLTLAYRASAPGRLGLLSIEYFECLSFSIELNVLYSRWSGKQRLKISYTPQGSSIKLGTTTITIPAFDGTTTDKCSDSPKATNLCPVPPDFTLQIHKLSNTSTDPQANDFTVTSSTALTSLTFLWEAQDGTPAMGNGRNFSTKFTSAGIKLITVTAFNETGCSATASLPVQMAG